MARPLRYRLLAVDIDGTLVNSRDELTPGVRAALREAADAGVKIVLATGRRYSRALPFAEPLGIRAPLVTASGALIKDPFDHRTLFRAHLERADLLEVLKVTSGHGFDAVLYGDTFHHGFDYYCPKLIGVGPELAEYYSVNAGSERQQHDLMHNPPDDIFAGFAMGTREQMFALEAELHRKLPGKLYLHVIRSPRYQGYMCEIAPAGATKWSGVRHVADAENIADHEICAVGDDVNDLPMLVGSGLGVAMGNAVEELKSAADRIAPHNDEDGLAEVVRWILDG
jgi:Cof subfamily protein (haloacid dehalogenase superfamily)